MRAAVIQNGVVVSVILVSGADPAWVLCAPEVAPGWAYNGSAFIAPPPGPALPPPATNAEMLNEALLAKGSVVRALGLVMFAEVNKLRVKNGDPAYTLAQFTAALEAQMGT